MISNLDVLLHVTTCYYQLLIPEGNHNVHGPQHGAGIHTATIKGQRWAVEAPEIFCVKLVKKVGEYYWC